MNKPILLCISQDDGLVSEIRHAFAGSPFAVNFCQTTAGALGFMNESPVSAVLVDFHPVALDAAPFLQVLSENDPTIVPIALCQAQDLGAALQAQANGILADIIQLPILKSQALAQVCRISAGSYLQTLSENLPDIADRIMAAQDNRAVLSLITELLVEAPRSVYSSVSADLHLGVTGWHTALFADAKQARQLDSMVNLLLRLARSVMDRIDNQSESAHSADYDDLSGVYNRQGLVTALAKEIERTERYGSLLALMVLDLDGFSELNRDFGRQTGDRILKGLGNILDGLTRRTDIIGRLGNDEFCLLLPGINLDQALKAAGRVKHEVRSWANAAMHEIPISLSFGITVYRKGLDKPEQLLSDALAALTHARAQGNATIGLFDGELQIAPAQA